MLVREEGVDHKGKLDTQHLDVLVTLQQLIFFNLLPIPHLYCDSNSRVTWVGGGSAHVIIEHFEHL